MFTEEQEAIIEDTCLSMVNDRETYLWGKNFFTPERLKLPNHKLRGIFGNQSYAFRSSLGREYLGRDHAEMQEIMERFYYHLFGKDLYPEEPTPEEIEVFITSSQVGTCKTASPCSEISLKDAQSNLTPDPKANEMSVESQNVNVPVAQVTLVYGKEIKGMTEGELISLIEQIEGKKKAFESLDPKSAYYRAQIAKINDAKALVAAELDSRV